MAWQQLTTITHRYTYTYNMQATVQNPVDVILLMRSRKGAHNSVNIVSNNFRAKKNRTIKLRVFHSKTFKRLSISKQNCKKFQIKEGSIQLTGESHTFKKHVAYAQLPQLSEETDSRWIIVNRDHWCFVVNNDSSIHFRNYSSFAE